MKFNISYRDIEFTTELTIRSKVKEIKEAVRARSNYFLRQPEFRSLNR